jgi:hypothetical protein
LPSIHHLRYTDVEAQIVADAEIGIHAAIPTAHQNAPALIGVHAALHRCTCCLAYCPPGRTGFDRDA